MPKLKLDVGDIITIPLGNNEIGFGQVVTPYDKKSGGFMLAIFSYKHLAIKNLNFKEICNSELLFLGLTFDAKLYHKDWGIIGNYKDNLEKIKIPFFRLGTPPDEIYIVNYKGDRLAQITNEIFNKLNYKTEIAPIRYENALKAHFGLQEWKKDDYDKLLYKHSIKSNEIYSTLKLI